MKSIGKYLVLTMAVLGLGLQVHACPGSTGSVPRIVCLADSLKATLTASQISTLELPYTYVNSETWSNLPVTMQARLGIKIGSLSTAQLAIAKAIVQEISGTTANEGTDEAMQLLLADDYLAANGGGTAYGAGQYYLCFNGTPSLTGLFSVKFGGHHLQVENTYNNGVMVGGTPHFEAIEPLTFVSGANTYSTLAQEKNALAAMFSTLSTTELASAKLTATFTDILMGAKNNGSYKDWIFPTTKVGLKVGSLTAAQKALVIAAIKTYVLDIDDANATAIMNQYTKELDETYISFSGNATLTTKNDYARIDGPGVWIEFTVQGGIVLSGVHYHSIWRDHTRDYGGAGSTAGVQTTAVGSSNPTSIETLNDLPFLRCYPNPTKDQVTVQFSLEQPKAVKLSVLNLLGQTVSVKTYTELPIGDQSIQFDVSNLASGLYYLILDADRSRSCAKIRKE